MRLFLGTRVNRPLDFDAGPWRTGRLCAPGAPCLGAMMRRWMKSVWVAFLKQTSFVATHSHTPAPASR